MLKGLTSYVGMKDNNQTIGYLLDKVKPKINKHLHNFESFTLNFIPLCIITFPYILRLTGIAT